MKEIDRLLKQWIPVNTIIREEIRNAIIKHKMESMDKAYAQGHKVGVEAGLDYKRKSLNNSIYIILNKSI